MLAKHVQADPEYEKIRSKINTLKILSQIQQEGSVERKLLKGK
jgi:hypothetical protein